MFGDMMKNTDEKWVQEKLGHTLKTLIWMNRNSQWKVPETPISKELMGWVQEVDPEGKMSELELSRQFLKDTPRMGKFMEMFKKDQLISEEVLDKYAQEWYNNIKKCLSSTSAAEWDAAEYQGQQIAAVVSVNQAEALFKKVRTIMEADAACPFILRKLIFGFLTRPTAVPTPTEEDEDTADKIIGLIKPELKKSDPDIYRALVDSLKWRGKKELTRTLAAVTKTPKERRKIRGRESCIFIESDEGVHYVG